MTMHDNVSPLFDRGGGDGKAAQPDEAAARIRQLEEQVAKLQKINASLINRVEQNTDQQGNAFSLFQRAILLEKQVSDRTQELQLTLSKLEHSNRKLSDAKEEADKARNRLLEAIEFLSEGFALFDTSDRLVLYNSRFLLLFPSLENLIASGATFAELLSAADERGLLLEPKGRTEAWLAVQREGHKRTGEPTIMALSSGQWIQINERLTAHGETVVIYTDVTEIKRSEARRRERALEAKSLQLTSTLDNLVQGVSVVDADRRIAYWNGRFLRLMGLPPGFIRVGMTFDEVLDSDQVNEAFPTAAIRTDLLDWSGAAFRHTVFRKEYKRKDGLVMEIQRKAMPDGGFVSTYTDITDKRLAAQLLEDAKETLEKLVVERTAKLTELNKQLRQAKSLAEQANLSKTKFLAAASHDLLQPLNAARLFLSAIPEISVSNEAQHFIGRVNTALDSVDDLLKALFDISKLDTGESRPEWSEFSVQGLLEALADEFGYLAQGKDLQFRVVTSSRVIRSDMLLLRRILQNFISNAIRYTAKGRILIGCRREAEGLAIEVWDTGPGIPAEHHVRIFDEFLRFVPPGSQSESGFGLGLAIAQRSARLLDCPIGLRSVVGKGSVFFVKVPYGNPIADLAPLKLGRQRDARAVDNATIVFIENDTSNLEGMTALLTKWGYQVICAQDAGEATAKIGAQQVVPDMIIADFHLDKGVTGLKAIDDVREHCGLPIPGFVITADHSAQIAEATKSAGYELLQKPVKPAQLRSLMGHTLA